MLRVGVLTCLIAGTLLSAAPQPQQPFHRPLTFEKNQGQFPAEVKWTARSSGYEVVFDDESATIVIPDKTALHAASTRLPGTPALLHIPYSAVRMKLAGSHPWKDISGAEPTGGVSNYLNRKDLKRSVNHIPQYGRMKVANVYKGIDLIFYTSGGDLEYDFAVAPGADPRQIQVVFDGTKEMRMDAQSGDLVVKLPVVEVAPDGTKLVQRIFSSTSGGNDIGMGVAVADRRPWITGKTCGDGFPTTDGMVHQLNHCAVFVVQMDEAGNRTMA
jgi:hypothetical protein